MRVSFIANPTAGRGRTRALAEDLARAVPGESELLWTQGPRHASALAAEAARRSDAVCVVGGDGTVSEVVNGLMAAPVPMVVVPTGSGNDFASLVGCPRNGTELARVLAEGEGLYVDVLDCGDRYCANSIGIGFEAMVTYHSLSIRNMRGLPLYLTAVFKALAQFESLTYAIEIGDETVSGEMLLVSVGNGVRAGGGFYLNPGAYPDDGLIDVCIARRMSRLRLLTVLPRAIKGTHVGQRGVETYRASRVTVRAGQPFPLHIDGEYMGRRETPLALSIIPRRLPVLSLHGSRARHTGPLVKLL